MDVKNTHSVTKTEISVFGRQALDAERRRSLSLADTVLMCEKKHWTLSDLSDIYIFANGGSSSRRGVLDVNINSLFII